jgi:hypothetical protein
VEVKCFFAGESNRNSGSFSKPVELFHSGNLTASRVGEFGRMLQMNAFQASGKLTFHKWRSGPAVVRQHRDGNAGAC